MNNKLNNVGSFIFIVFMGISLSLNNVSAAENNKKSVIKSSPSQTSNQQTKSDENNNTPQTVVWEQEPTSFMGIELGQPLSKSVSTQCLSEKGEGKYVDWNALKSLEGRLCQFKQTFMNDDTIEVYGFKVPFLFDHGSMTTLDKTLDGAVGQFQIRFTSGYFSQIKDMLIIKFGIPSETVVEKVKTKGGAEFENIVLTWRGKNVLIKVQSLVEREFVVRTLSEKGMINVYTTEYLAKAANSSIEASKKAAAGL